MEKALFFLGAFVGVFSLLLYYLTLNTDYELEQKVDKRIIVIVVFLAHLMFIILPSVLAGMLIQKYTLFFK
jgi:hypothetical protein